MFPAFALQIYSLKLAANLQRLLGIQYTRSLIGVHAGSLVLFFFVSFHFCLFLLNSFRKVTFTRVFAEDQSIIWWVVVRLDLVGQIMCNYGRSDAYKLFLSKFKLLHTWHSIEFHVHVCVYAVQYTRSVWSAGENCALTFWFCFVFISAIRASFDPSRCERVSKWGTCARAHKHKHLWIPSTRF